MQSRNNIMSYTNLTNTGTNSKKLPDEGLGRASGINAWHELTGKAKEGNFNTIIHEAKQLKKNKSSVRKIVFHNLPGNNAPGIGRSASYGKSTFHNQMVKNKTSNPRNPLSLFGTAAASSIDSSHQYEGGGEEEF